MAKIKIYKQFLILLIITLGLACLIFLIAYNASEKRYENLPWQINVQSDAQSSVLGINVGSDTLATVIDKMKTIPEIALFKDNKRQNIEAYFGKMTMGSLVGRVIAEVDSPSVYLDRLSASTMGKPMPSGKRKVILSEKDVENVNRQRVWKLVYIPSADYDATQLQRFFGEPSHVRKLDENITYWYYPDKGLVVELNLKSSDVFYYVARSDYPRLLQQLTPK